MAQTVKLRRSSVSGQKPINSNLQLGELALNTTDGKVYMAKSGSLGPSVEELVTTNTFNTGSVNISGSINLEGNQTITGSLVVSDGVGFINNGLISENSNIFLTSGSNIYVQDGGIISGSALQGDGSGIINIPLSGITNLTIISGSFDERINQITGSVDSINNFTSSVVLTSQTSSMTVMSASYALTASYALNASVGGGGSATGTYSLLTQTVAATTWSFEHNTGQRYPIFQVFNDDGDVIIPTQIRTLDENNAEIIFGTAQSGKVVASLGGGNGMTEEFTNSNLWIVDHNLNIDYPDVTIWDSNRNIIFPDRIESVDANQIKVYFSIPVSGHVSVSRGGHIISGSVDLEWDNILNKPTGLVSSSSQILYSGLTGIPSGIISGSDQLTGSYDDRYVLSGSITQTTWDNIANKPNDIVSSSSQISAFGFLQTSSFNTFTSSYTTGSFTGSFIGDGTNLYNIPASGVTGLNLNKIISGSVSASISPDKGLEINTDVYIDGTLTAKELYINYISSSVLYESGSTKFGDTSDDNHSFTGSVLIDGGLSADSIIGSINFNNLTNVPTLVSGSSQIDITGTTGYSTFSSSVSSSIGLLSSSIATTDFNQDGRLVNLETSTGSLNSFTSSINTTIKSKLDGDGVISGSIQVIYSGLTGIPSGIVSGSSQIVYSGLTGIPSGIVSSSSQISEFGFLETGSFNSYTSSTDSRLVSVENVTFGLSGSFATILDNSFVGTQKMTGSLIVSSSLNVIGTQNVTGSLIVSNSLKVIGNENINGNLSVTGSVVISGSLDISNANVGSSRYLHTQNNSSATWSITHNLNYDYPNVTVYDGSTNRVMLPADVISVDANTTQITFATPEYGYALVSVGGITTATADRFLFTVTSATGSWVIDHNLGFKYPNIDVYDENDEQLIPQKVTAVSVNRTEVDFATPTSGNAIITLGGPRSAAIFNQTGSFYNTQNNIGITGSLVVTGDVDANNFNTTSDKKLKTDLIKIEGALDKIEKLNGYTFNWLEGYNEDRTRQIGLIADEVYEVQPELISNRSILLGGKEEEIKLLDYSKVTALLLEGIKELTERVAKLENKRKKK